MLLLGISFEDIADAALNFFIMIGIHINAMIYNIATFLFDIFVSIISATIFNTEDFEKIANSIYLVIGVVALFIVSYALLRAIVDPDGAAKSSYSVKKIIPNILIAVVLIAFVPFIFDNAYKLQSAVVRSNVIPNVIFGRNLNGVNATDGTCDVKNGEGCSQAEYVEKSGRMMTNDVFIAFFVPTQPIVADNKTTYSSELNKYYDSMTITDCWLFFCDGNTLSFKDAVEGVNEGTEGFGVYAEFSSYMHGKDKLQNKLEYNWLLQLISGVFLIYVLANFCIDMAVRVVKLGYFQIIAPIPILTLMIPGQKKIFDNWMKNSIQTFLDVFLRIFIIFFGILLINMLPDLGDDLWRNSLSPNHPNIARAFIMIGILIFMKQAPKLISDIFGLNPTKLGIKDKLGEMALIGDKTKELMSSAQGAASGALGAGWTSKMNGGTFRGGMKYGLAQGFKNGASNPHQFKAMRQKIYNDGMGFTGKAGLFGGRGMMDKWIADTTNRYSDDYQDRILPTIVNNAENYANPNSLLHRFYQSEFADRSSKQSRIVSALKVKHDEAEANLNHGRVAFEDRKEEALEQLNTRRDRHIEELTTQRQIIDASEKAALSSNDTFSKYQVEVEEKKKRLLDAMATATGEEMDRLDKELEKVKNLKLEDSDIYNQIVQDFNKKRDKVDKDFDKYNQDFNKVFDKLKNSKYEDTDEYKDLKEKYDAISEQYHEEDGKLNNRSELIIKSVWDPILKKRVEKVYNPHATSEADRYIDMSDEEGKERAKVTQVELDAFKEAIKDAKDADPTYDAAQTANKKRENYKKNKEWANSEEGQHMDMMFKKYVGDNSSNTTSSSKKDNK